MTYTPEQINLIQSLGDSRVAWVIIGRALGKSVKALSKFWSRYKAIEGLPPIVKIDKSITVGRVGTKIKKAIRDDGFRSLYILKEQLGPCMYRFLIFYILPSS
jgi:hypothetical protein